MGDIQIYYYLLKPHLSKFNEQNQKNQIDVTIFEPEYFCLFSTKKQVKLAFQYCFIAFQSFIFVGATSKFMCRLFYEL